MKRLLCWKNRVTNFQFVEFKKFNMKCEIERMEIIYTFYFFAFFVYCLSDMEVILDFHKRVIQGMSANKRSVKNDE